MPLASEVVRAANFRRRTLFFSADVPEATFTVLSSRKNSLLSVYAVSRDKDSLLQSHGLPYSLSGRFPHGPHAGFYVTHPGSRDASTASLIQLTSRGALYQTALTVCENEDETPSPVTIDVSWSSAVQRLATASRAQQADVGKLGARSMQEVDFRQVYQRISFLASRLMLVSLTSFQDSFIRLTAQMQSIPQIMLVLSIKHWM